ncbi:MAG: hypothetical protein D6776_09685, partial [Planctomycetota bacterium]
MNGGGPIRAAIVCPGRGSYGRTELGSLSAARAAGPSPRLDAMLAALDERRAARGLEPLLALDTAPRFSARTHLRADNASALILAGAAADLDLVEEAVRTRRIEPVVVCGNSLGWYTALWVAGALDTARAARLVDTMAALQVERGVEG